MKDEHALKLLKHWYRLENGDQVIKVLGDKAPLSRLLMATKNYITEAEKEETLEPIFGPDVE